MQPMSGSPTLKVWCITYLLLDPVVKGRFELSVIECGEDHFLHYLDLDKLPNEEITVVCKERPEDKKWEALYLYDLFQVLGLVIKDRCYPEFRIQYEAKSRPDGTTYLVIKR